MERTELPQNPYPGLRPFEFAENHLFFGREGQSEELLKRLQESHFLAVVGSSGSGKSSLVRAGLLPLLYGGFMQQAGSKWRIALFRPGDDPIRNLSAALVEPAQLASTAVMSDLKVDEDIDLRRVVTETNLRRSAVGLREYPRQGALKDDENLIVIVDQFEEIFRFKRESQSQGTTPETNSNHKSDDEAAAFVKLLLEAVGEKPGRVYVVITMRSDFLGNCSEFYGLPEAINSGQYLIPRLTRNQLRAVIESPAKVRGVQMSPILSVNLLNEMGDDQDQLPVLQHVLMRTWDEWAKANDPAGEIGQDHYDKTGGMAMALSNHADEVVDLLGGTNTTERLSKQKLVEKIFKRLTEIDEENRETRRPVSLDKLCDIRDTSREEIVSIIDAFRDSGRTFLMPPIDLPLEDGTVIDISHESLIRKWTTLRKWVEEESISVRNYRRYAESARLHADNRKGMFSEPELSEALDWYAAFAPTETWAMLNYRKGDERFRADYATTIAYIEKHKEKKEEDRKAEEARAQLEAIEMDRKLREQLSREEEDKRRIEQEREQLRKQAEELAKQTGLEDPAGTLSSPVQIDTPYIERAKQFLRGKVLSPAEALTLAKELKAVKAFGYARRVLERAVADKKLNDDPTLKLKTYQEWALCTYKDTDLSADGRLDKALDIFRAIENLETTVNQETLGQLGAIFKRKWEVDSQKQGLERSLMYYRRGYMQGAENDQGYTGINTAFVLDLLADQEDEEAIKAGTTSASAIERRNEARRIREDIVQKVGPLVDKPESKWLAEQWWFYSTMAEALFGLQEYDKAAEWLRRGKTALGKVPEWEEESTINQLARLAIIQNSSISPEQFEGSIAWNVLSEAFGNYPAAVRTAFRGKIGLAMSGGGFRAALFHIGTLAKLAELDVLRSVEVLSCVSGGSIIGAHYYLEVRHLLRHRSDAEITRKDYIDLVKRIEKAFLDGVQTNIRMRITGDVLANAKMIFSSLPSRTARAGDLYETKIFSRIEDGEGDSPRWLNELNIFPKDEPQTFAPKLHNWRRAAKAPILVLNAATLNTGHNWQFTTTWMGEPPSSIDAEVDTNDILRRMYYAEAPLDHKRIRLGHAVSASACVPGVFEPLILDQLYPERVVRLVDGGVCDNQGISSLLEQDCTVILVSDGSGQMVSQKMPSNGLVGVPLRANSILQARIRDAQYHDLEKRRRAALLRGLMFIHLKEGLDGKPVDWVDCLDPYPPARAAILTRYGVAKDMQQCLAAMRTDLDAFSDVEAYALMTSGYRMTEDAFNNLKCVEGFSDDGVKPEWRFLGVEDGMKGAGARYQYAMSLLRTSNSVPFKIWKQFPLLKTATSVLALLAFGVLATAMYFLLAGSTLISQITVGMVAIGALAFIVVFAGIWLIAILTGRSMQLRESLVRIVFGVGLTSVGSFAALIHFSIFERLFLKRGSLATFLAKGSAGDLSEPTKSDPESGSA